MTHKEIAERLRGIVNYNLHSSNIKALADELDPPHRPVVVSVVIPPVSEWPSGTDRVEWRFISNNQKVPYRAIITRAEAERMEADQ